MDTRTCTAIRVGSCWNRRGNLVCFFTHPWYVHLVLAVTGPYLTGNRHKSCTVDIPKEVKDALRKFRFARRNQGHAAIVIKINKKELKMEVVEEFDDISLEDLAEGERYSRYVSKDDVRLLMSDNRTSEECTPLCRTLV